MLGFQRRIILMLELELVLKKEKSYVVEEEQLAKIEHTSRMIHFLYLKCFPARCWFGKGIYRLTILIM
jgi:hypothetical protein